MIIKENEVLAELKRISTEPYLEEDHTKNHQTYAKALFLLLRKATR